MSSSASPATKAFASIVGSSSAEPAPPSMSAEADQREMDYYKALRGLNVSFLSAVSKAIDSDPFVDVADLLERYKALRVSVKSGFDEKTKPAAHAPSLPSFTESKPAEAPKPAPAFSMPAPPASYAGFKPPAASSTTATSSSTGGGFVPKIDSSSSGSSLGSPFSFATSKPAAESSAISEPPKTAFPFGSTNSTSGPATSTLGSSSFTFGAPSSSSSTSIFGGKAPASTSSTSFFAPSTSSTSIFGASSTSSSIFGGSSTFGSKPLAADSSNDADDEKDKDKDNGKDKDDKKTIPFTFSSSGSGASTPFGASSAGTGTGTTTPEKDKAASATNPFSFGSASPGKPSLFSGFGTAKAGSIGNPVGFGFGSPPRTPDAEADAGSSGPVKALPFSFGAPRASAFTFGSGATSASAPAEDKKEGSSGSGSGEGTPAPASGEGSQAHPPPLLASSSVHDLEGEGEEDEVTTHEIRSKVFRMTKDKEGKAQWGDLGVGMLRLKRHKETEARRVLLRNSGTGKITINFLVHGGLNPTVSDKVVSFMGHSEGASTPYRIRCKTADQAKELKAALDRELDFVKNKH